MRTTSRNKKNNNNTRKIRKQDPLYKVKRISDPITVALYVKDGKRILLLGDQHLVNKYCKKCEAPDCLDYLSLVKALDDYHKDTGTELDVYIETFAPNDGTSTFGKGLLYLQNSILGRQEFIDKNTPLRIYNVRKALTLKAYFHGKEARRYHYIDFRLTELFEKYGFSIFDILHGILQGSEEDVKKYHENFLKMYPTKSSYVDIIKQFCFAKKFDPSLKDRSLLSQGMTKPAKQFNKLPLKEQRLVKSFIMKQIKYYMTTYDYKNIHGFASNVFYISMMIMDTYAICRFLYYHAKQPEGSTSLFIAGASHTNTYALFLEEWGAKQIYEHTYNFFDVKYKACTKVDFKSLIEQNVPPS